VTIEKRVAPAALALRAQVIISSVEIRGKTGIFAWWNADWAQKLQFSEHLPDRAAAIAQQSTSSPQKCCRILSAKAANNGVSSSLTVKSSSASSGVISPPAKMR